MRWCTQQAAQDEFDALLMDQRMPHDCVVHMLLRDIKVGCEGDRVGLVFLSHRPVSVLLCRKDVGITVWNSVGRSELSLSAAILRRV